ncbi:MAG: LPS export ABC transporter periplasmic protein LptC [Burkholderiales bacterium]|nr:LPS export ABC transporter periplasmic protein LptC [Burkholderiales bacterium]
MARRTLLDRATGWSPVLLLGGLAALTYWLDAQVQPEPPRRDGSQRHDPDLYVEGFRAVELDAQGRARQVIAGKRALHFGDDQTTEVTEPMLSQTEPGKPAFRVTAALGKLSGDRKDVWFTGDVRAVRAAGPARPGSDPVGPVTVITEYLHVVPDKELARTDKPVTIEEPRGIIHSVGLELDNKAKTLKLTSGVQGTLQPNALPPQALPTKSK